MVSGLLDGGLAIVECPAGLLFAYHNPPGTLGFCDLVTQEGWIGQWTRYARLNRAQRDFWNYRVGGRVCW